MVDTMAGPLAQLHDIHLPRAIGWWPLAWGWFFLFFFGCVLLIVGVHYIHRYYCWGQARRQALSLLRNYEKEFQQGTNISFLSAQLSELLRRVALAYFPRQDIAGLQGELWLAFLTKTAKGLDFTEVREALLIFPYRLPHAMNPGSVDNQSASCTAPTSGLLSAETTDFIYKAGELDMNITCQHALERLFLFAKKWIAQRRRPCSN